VVIDITEILVRSVALAGFALDSGFEIFASLVVAVLMRSPPPDAKPARVMRQREVGVQDDPVHAVIHTGNQIAVAGHKFVR
jgi:hypothetical protein